MSKAMEIFKTKIRAVAKAPGKFTASALEGSRILPSRNKDAEFQLRIDAGHYDAATKKLNVVLQVNSQAKSPALVNFIKRNTTHGKLATAAFDTAAKDQQAEFEWGVEELTDKGKENL
jgi:hypothetical protein